MRLEAEHRGGDERREQDRQQQGEREGSGEAPAEAAPENARDVGPEAEECPLCERQRAGVTEDELVADDEQGVDPRHRHQAKAVGRAKDQRLGD